MNFPAKEDTLFSTSPSAVVKSSCWFQVSVPHSPRTFNTALTQSSLDLYSWSFFCHNRDFGHLTGTLCAKPGCRVMSSRGPSRCQSSWAPNAWIRTNEEEALRTARSPVTTGSASLWPFNVTVPGNGRFNKEEKRRDNTEDFSQGKGIVLFYA